MTGATIMYNALSGYSNRAADVMGLMSEEETLRVQLDALRQEHRALDEQIADLSNERLADPLAVRRLKKRKLALKDLITRIEDQLYPDIIA